MLVDSLLNEYYFRAMDVKMELSWANQLNEEFVKPYYRDLMSFIDTTYVSNKGMIFPEKHEIYRAFECCNFDEVKVVILGQDPYPTRGHANGLCFSVDSKVQPLPKSLVNIYKEIESDLGAPANENGDLSRWANQGVLMLNSVLTVHEGDANSHKNVGWERFTDAVISILNDRKQGIVYMLWGAKAIEKAKNVSKEKNCVLTSPHPSPLSAYRGFFGCKHFSKANEYLTGKGSEEILW